jgi:hypothetical protein
MATITDRILEWFGGVPRAQAEKRAVEAYKTGYNDGGEDEPVSGTTAKYGYRRATTGGLRDFSNIDHDQILNIVWTIWQSNPVAKRALTIKRDYIVGSGVNFNADDPALQDILDTFWRINALDRRIREFTLQLFLFGEQCYPVFVRRTDGQVRLGYVDPGDIGDVIEHPENALDMWAVVVKSQETIKPWAERHGERVYRIVREGSGGLQTAEQSELEDWETKMLKSHGLEAYSGSCFYERVNSVSNQPRGYSDLLQVADWLDQHDETLFALADREQMAGYFSWDVTLTGANKDAILERAKQLRALPPKKGSVNVHNEAEVWQFNFPDLKQVASIETAKELITFILGGLGLPRHWYGYGDETNRATAQAQGDPTWRSLKHDQGIIQDMIERMLAFVRDQAQLVDVWPLYPDSSTEITINMPEMTSKDMASLATSAGAIATALTVAVQNRWMSNETAAEVWAHMVSELGVEVNATEEIEAAQGEQDEVDLDAGQSANDWLIQHGVLMELPQGANP